MKLTRQEEVALLLAAELARSSGTFVSLADIGKRHGVSQLFLKNIARLLRQQGIIAGKEGQSGGYMLSRSPGSISAFEVMQAVSGKTREQVAEGPFSCPLYPSCTPQKIRKLISEAFKRYTSDITIDEFVKDGGVV